MAAAAAAAKSLQSCPTLCDPIDGSPPGSPVPGILQARTLEWVAISFPSAWKWKVKGKLLSRVRLLVTPWTTAYQAPPSMGFFQARVVEWGCHCLLCVWLQYCLKKKKSQAETKTNCKGSGTNNSTQQAKLSFAWLSGKRKWEPSHIPQQHFFFMLLMYFIFFLLFLFCFSFFWCTLKHMHLFQNNISRVSEK